jgi:hypothetical protein
VGDKRKFDNFCFIKEVKSSQEMARQEEEEEEEEEAHFMTIMHEKLHG